MAASEWQALPIRQRVFQGHGLTRLGAFWKQFLGASDQAIQPVAQLSRLKIIAVRLLMNRLNRTREFANQSNDIIHKAPFHSCAGEYAMTPDSGAQ